MLPPPCLEPRFNLVKKYVLGNSLTQFLHLVVAFQISVQGAEHCFLRVELKKAFIGTWGFYECSKHVLLGSEGRIEDV